MDPIKNGGISTQFRDPKQNKENYYSKRSVAETLDKIASSKSNQETKHYGKILEKQTGLKSPEPGLFDFFKGNKSIYYDIHKDFTQDRVKELYMTAMSDQDKEAVERLHVINDLLEDKNLRYKDLVKISRNIEKMHTSSRVMPLRYAISSKDMFDMVGIVDENINKGYFSYSNLVKQNRDRAAIKQALLEESSVKNGLKPEHFKDFYKGMAASGLELVDLIKNVGSFGVYLAGKATSAKQIMDIGKNISDFSLSNFVKPETESGNFGKTVGDVIQTVGIFFAGLGASPKTLTSLNSLKNLTKFGKTRALKGFSVLAANTLMRNIIDKTNFEKVTKKGLEALSTLSTIKMLSSMSSSSYEKDPVEIVDRIFKKDNSNLNDINKDLLNNENSSMFDNNSSAVEDNVIEKNNISETPVSEVVFEIDPEIEKNLVKAETIKDNVSENISEKTEPEIPLTEEEIKNKLENEKISKVLDFVTKDRKYERNAETDYEVPISFNEEKNISQDVTYGNVVESFYKNHALKILENKGYALKEIPESISSIIDGMSKNIIPPSEAKPHKNLLTYTSFSNNNVADIGLALDGIQEKASLYSLIEAAKKEIPELHEDIRDVEKLFLTDNSNTLRKFGLGYSDLAIKEITEGKSLALDKVDALQGFIREYKNAVNYIYNEQFNKFRGPLKNEIPEENESSILDEEDNSRESRKEKAERIDKEVKPMMNDLHDGLVEVFNNKNFGQILVDIDPREFKLENGEIVGPGVQRLLNAAKGLNIKGGREPYYDMALEIRNTFSKGKQMFKYSNAPEKKNYAKRESMFALLYDLTSRKAQGILEYIEQEILSKESILEYRNIQKEYAKDQEAHKAYNVDNIISKDSPKPVQLMNNIPLLSKMLNKAGSIPYEVRTSLLKNNKYKGYYQNTLVLGNKETFADRFRSITFETILGNELKSLDSLTSGLSDKQKSNSIKISKLKELLPEDKFGLTKKFIDTFNVRNEAKRLARFRDFTPKLSESIDKIINDIDSSKVGKSGFKIGMNLFGNVAKQLGVSPKLATLIVNYIKSVISSKGEVSNKKLLIDFIKTIYLNHFQSDVINMGGEIKNGKS